MYIPPISYGWDSNPCAVSVKDVFLTENAHCYRSPEVKQAVDYAMDGACVNVHVELRRGGAG